MHLPDQDLAGFDSTEAASSGCGKPCGVSLIKRALRLEVQLTAGHVQVNERRIRDGDALAGFDSGDVEGGATVADPDNLTHQVMWSSRSLE
jgi:hypothetical protein